MITSHLILDLVSLNRSYTIIRVNMHLILEPPILRSTNLRLIELSSIVIKPKYLQNNLGTIVSTSRTHRT